MVTIGFFGSSDIVFAKKFESEIRSILIQVFQKYPSVRLFTGGYSGIMELVPRISRELLAEYPENKLENYGVLYKGYDESPNQYLDKAFTAKTIGQRVDYILSMSDIIYAFPGSSGTHHEILQTLESIKYPSSETLKVKQFFIHEYWNDHIKTEFESSCFFNYQTKFEFKLPMIELENTPKKVSQINILDSIKEFEGIYKDDLNVLAFDFAYSLYGNNFGINQGVNKSKFIKPYDRILDDFLSKNSSILSNKGSFSSYSRLSNPIYFGDDQIYETDRELILDTLSETKSEELFIKWNKHLENSDFGKLSFWVNESFGFDDISVNISCFVVLNIDLPDTQCERTLDILYHYIVTEGLRHLIKAVNKHLTLSIKLTKFKNYALAHKHTIKNYGFNFYLNYLLESFKGNSNYVEMLNNVENILKVRDLSSQLIYSFDKGNSKDIYESYGVYTIYDLILLLRNSGTLAYRGLENFQIKGEVDSNTVNRQVNPHEFLDLFNILSNLYSNTRKHSNDESFDIIIDFAQKSSIEILFKNYHLIDQQYLDRLNGLSLSGYYNKHKGFNQISTSIRRLGYLELDTTKNEQEKSTTIKLLIYENTNY